MKCVKCGKEVSAEWKMCPFCGEPVEKTCPKCGKPIDAEWKLCPFCGAELKTSGDTEKAKPAAEKEEFRFEFSEDTAGLAESFDKQLKEKAKPQPQPETKTAEALSQEEINRPKGILKKREIKLFSSGEKGKKATESIIYYAERGDALFQYYYGLYLYVGWNGLKSNYKDSFKWYMKSADQGNCDAMEGIGNAYKFGNDYVVKDLKKAKEWYIKAAKAGSKSAKEELEKMGVKI